MVAFTAETNDPWPVPAEFEKMKNPVKSNAESIAIGKELFAKHCKSCHGKFGEGDGPKASELKTDCGDFTSDKFKAQSDGAIFYKTKKGRDEMPNFGKKMTDDEEIWHVVNFLRTLGK
ncbi:MAG: c-type cytochrome [Flavobacteriales bacterium]|nr:c-type cytochrome [Flavobacteriales bacterium]